MAGLFNFGGGDSPLARFLDPEIALPLAAGLMSGGSNMQNIGQAFANVGPAIGQQRQQRRLKAQTNETRQFFIDNGLPEYADAIDRGLPAGKAWDAWLKDRALEAQTPKSVEYGLQPIYGQDENGDPVLGTLGKDGTFKKIDTGGVKIQTGVDKVDLGTRWGLLNKRTGQIEGYMPKDIAGEEAQKEIGAAQGKAAASASGDLQAGQNALDLIQVIRNDPYKSRGTGFSSIGNAIPGTGGYDFQNKVDQAKAGAFLTAIQQMRGLGALSNAEGSAATAAVTRMNTATSEEEFDAALDQYEAIVRQGMMRAQGRMQQPAGAAPMGPNPYKEKYGLD